jgi:OmpA-OmpF porin, OOP family
MRFQLKWFACSLLFVGVAQAQEIQLQVELMNRLSTETGRKGDLISGRVQAPNQFQGDIVEGTITESRSGAKSGGSSSLSVDFTTLRHGGNAVRIKSRLSSVVNSKGNVDVDESGRMVRRASGNSGNAVKSAGVGSRLGGLLGGGRGATIGSLADTATGAIVQVSADGPNIDFNPGSRFVLDTSRQDGGSLASLAPNQPVQTTPASLSTSTAAPTSQPAAQPQTAAAQTSAPAAGSQPVLTTLKSTFIPGEKTIFYDDFSDMGPDDAPAHFKVRGASPELRGSGNLKQLTMLAKTTLSPNLTALPANFTYEAEMAFDTGTSCVNTEQVYYSKNTEVFRFFMSACKEYTDVIASLRAPYSELGRKRINTAWNQPKTLQMWFQNGRFRVFLDGEKQLDVNQVVLQPVDKVELDNSFTANNGSIGYRMVRFAESTPDFSQVISSSGRYVTHGILFDTDSDRMKAESAAVIQSIARGLENNPNLKLLIEGHTDSVGNADHNLDLSRRRAEAVKSVLTSQFNIDPARLSTSGLGATKPIDSNDTPQGRSQNRRVELVKQ